MMIDKTKQLFWVETSFNECKNIGIKSEYSVEEFENQGTLIDVVNNAHKKGLFEDIEDKLVYIFDEVLEYTGKLIIIIKNTLIYINEKCLINVK